jgi:hypothetical protein
MRATGELEDAEVTPSTRTQSRVVHLITDRFGRPPATRRERCTGYGYLERRRLRTACALAARGLVPYYGLFDAVFAGADENITMHPRPRRFPGEALGPANLVSHTALDWARLRDSGPGVQRSWTSSAEDRGRVVRIGAQRPLRRRMKDDARFVRAGAMSPKRIDERVRGLRSLRLCCTGNPRPRRCYDQTTGCCWFSKSNRGADYGRCRRAS